MKIVLEVMPGRFVRGENEKFFVEIGYHLGKKLWLYEVYEKHRETRTGKDGITKWTEDHHRLQMHGFKETFSESLHRLKQVMKESVSTEVTYSDETEQAMVREFDLFVPIDWEKELG